MNFMKTTEGGPKTNSIMEFSKKNLSTLIAIIIAVSGALLNFAGICIQQVNINNIKGIASNMNASSASYALGIVLDEKWFHTAFYIAVLIAFSMLAMRSSFDKHRMTLMAFLAIGFVYLTSDMFEHIIAVRADDSPNPRPGRAPFKKDLKWTVGGPATSFAGCVLMSLAWVNLMMFTGGMPEMPAIPFLNRNKK